MKTTNQSNARTSRTLTSSDDEALEASWTLVENALASYDLSYEPSNDCPNDKELLEKALYERFAEKGLRKSR